MKKIVTAIGNEILNKKLKMQNDIKVIGNDIQYQDGIFEILEKEIEIDFFIISEKICEKENLKKIIEKIKQINKKIKIIIILENKDEQLENILLTKGANKIIYHNQIEIKDIINIINNIENKYENEKLKKEISDLKNLIIETKQKEKNESSYKNIIKKIKINLLKKKKIKNEYSKKAQIISISGPSGVGKSIVAVNMAKSMAYKKQKILMIDFDILNNSLYTILGVKKIPQKINEDNLILEKFIVKINKKIDLISATNILFNTNEKIDYIKIEKILNELKQKYNIIIIDTSSECFFDFTKTIIKISDKSIFVTETNILEIKKAKELLNIYINEWKINKEKFNILFNKYDKECININLLKKIFCEFNIIGTLKYTYKYNKLINKNNKNSFKDRNIRNEYIKINNKI